MGIREVILMAASRSTGRSASPRPDLQAHDSAMRAPFAMVIRELIDILGARLVAYIAKVSETRAVHEWGARGRGPQAGSGAPRLRLALQVASLIARHDSHEVAQAWFQGLNPQLGDRSPARLLREGDLSEVGPEIVGAARAFVIGG
jgi:hypothetical protein